MTKQITTPPT